MRTECPQYSPIAFHRVHPGGSNNWQLHASMRSMRAFRLGLCPKRDEGRRALWVAANRGSTGTRPAEAEHCDD